MRTAEEILTRFRETGSVTILVTDEVAVLVAEIERLTGKLSPMTPISFNFAAGPKPTSHDLLAFLGEHVDLAVTGPEDVYIRFSAAPLNDSDEWAWSRSMLVSGDFPARVKIACGGPMRYLTIRTRAGDAVLHVTPTKQ